MGFFDIFKKKQNQSVSFQHLPDWVKSNKIWGDAEQLSKEARADIKLIVKDAKKKLDFLEESALRNEDIPVRVKQIMEGHRKNYIRKVNSFLDSLEIPEDPNELMDFSEQFSKKLDVLGEETHKNYFVLKEFLDKEVSDIALSIKKIENNLSKMKKRLENMGLPQLGELNEALDKYHRTKLSKKDGLVSVKVSKEAIKKLKQEHSESSDKISRLKGGSKMKEYTSLLKKQEDIPRQINKTAQDMLLLFSTLEKAMKKYKRGSMNEQLVDDYLHGPLRALINDKDMEILSLLSKLEDAIPTLGLDHKKEQKTRAALKSINKEFLTKKKEDIIQLNTELEDTTQKIKKYMILMEIEEEESLLAHLDQKIVALERELQNLKTELELTDPNKIKERIMELTQELGIEVPDEKT